MLQYDASVTVIIISPSILAESHASLVKTIGWLRELKYCSLQTCVRHASLCSVWLL